MRALLALIMRGRTQAMTASAAIATLSLMVPPLGYVSGAVIGLATLKQGAREGAVVIAGTVVLAGVFAMLLAGSPAPALVFLGLSWLPAWLLSVVLASTRSQGAALATAALLGVLAVLVVHLAVPEPAQAWREMLERLFAPAMSERPGLDAAQRADLEAQMGELLDVWAPQMTQVFGASTVFGLMLPLLLARWAHAVLDNPGGFGREFRELRVGQLALGVSVCVVLLATFSPGALGGLVGDLMGPVAAMLVFQGLAVAHGVVHERGASRGWLFALYLLLVVPPHLAVPVLSLAGLLDGWFDFRARARARS